MKKLFLVLLSGGIMMTACKKEELKPSIDPNVSCNFRLLKHNISEKGFVGDLYENANDGKLLFLIEFTNSPKIQLTKNYVERGSFFRCEGSSDECEVDHVNGIVYVRKGSDPKR